LATGENYRQRFRIGFHLGPVRGWNFVKIGRHVSSRFEIDNPD
jgi:hypothetical protein